MALASVPARHRDPPRALIAPHAGLRYSGPVAAHAYALVRSIPYDVVVLVGPSHFVGFEGVAVWPRGTWTTPLGPLAIEEGFAASLADAAPVVREYPIAHGREHSLELQLPFLGRLLPQAPIVPLVMGYQTRGTSKALGDALADVVARYPGRVLLVASSDLSHYHDADTAAALDAVVVRHVGALDPDGLMTALEADSGHACGGGPMVSVLEACRRLGASRAEVLCRADSGDVSGDKTAVVGYLAAAVW